MKMINLKFRMNPIAFGVFVTCISILFLLVSGTIVGVSGIPSGYASLAREAVFFLFSIVFIKMLGLTGSCLHFEAGAFVRGIKIGALFLIVILPSLGPFFLISSKDLLSPGFARIISTVVFAFTIGFAEELVFRVGILRGTEQYYRSKGLNPGLKPALISSVMFGLIHGINFFVNRELVFSTIAQVLYAFGIGLFIAAIYLITDNFLVIVFWHGLIDLVAGLRGIFIKGEAGLNLEVAKDIGLIAFIIQVIIALVFSIAGYKLIRSRQLVNDTKI